MLMGKGFLMTYKTLVDQDKCTGCEECLEVCTVHVFEMLEGKAVSVHQEECLGCQSCVQACAEDAISVNELKVELSETCLSLLREIL